MFVQLHLGVNSGSARFAVEWQAVNEATFRYPDELGWQPKVDFLSYFLSCYCMSTKSRTIYRHFIKIQYHFYLLKRKD